MAVAERPFWHREQSGTVVEPFLLNRRNFAALVAGRVANFIRELHEELDLLPFELGVDVYRS